MISLSEALRVNTTLTTLNLSGECQIMPIRNDSNGQLRAVTSTDIDTRESGPVALCKALATNIALTDVSICGEHQPSTVQKRISVLNQLTACCIDMMMDRPHKNHPLCELLRKNTTLTRLKTEREPHPHAVFMDICEWCFNWELLGGQIWIFSMNGSFIPSVKHCRQTQRSFQST